MREHLGLLPVLASSKIIRRWSSAGSSPFQAMLPGRWSRWHRLLAGLCQKHYRVRLRPGSPLKSNINYTAALWLLLYLPGVLQGAGIFMLQKWACQNSRLRLVNMFRVAGSCRWVPLLFGGGGQEEGLFSQSLKFSQSHFDLPFAVLWDHIVTGMEA